MRLALILWSVACTLGFAADKSTPQNKGGAAAVVLVSDGNTWVAVHRVDDGRLILPPRKFDTHAINLAPADYEIVGRRVGYRDEYVTLKVTPGMPAKRVSVICTVSARANAK